MTTIIAPADVTLVLILIGFVATFLTVATAWIFGTPPKRFFRMKSDSSNFS